MTAGSPPRWTSIGIRIGLGKRRRNFQDLHLRLGGGGGQVPLAAASANARIKRECCLHAFIVLCVLCTPKQADGRMSISRPFAALPHRTTEGEHVFPLLRHRISEFSPPPPLRAAAAHPESLFAPWEVFVFGTFSLTGDETVLTSITNSWQAASGTARLEKQRRNEGKKYWNEGKETTRHGDIATR